MKKILLLLTSFLLVGVLSAQNEQRKKANDLADQTKVFPVPAESTGQLNVLFEQPVSISSVRLVRSDGWEPNAGWHKPQQVQQQMILNLPKLSTGFYVLKFITFNNLEFYKKVIVFR